MSAQLWGIADLEPFGSVSRSDAFAIPSYFCVYSLPPSHVFHIVFFFLENLNAEVLHLIGLILVVPIQEVLFFVIPYYYLRTCRLDKSWFTSYNIFMSCRVYILSLLVPLDTLQVAYGLNYTRLFHCRMLYSTYVFTSFLLEVKNYVFNLFISKVIMTFCGCITFFPLCDV